jgi:hypothetical protein
MVVIDRVTKHDVPTKAYFGVPLEYLNFNVGSRVLPAQYFNEPNLNFTLKAKHEPGEKFFPNGGFEVYGPSGEKRSYELDQLIVHPYELKQFNYFSKKPTTEVINPDTPKRKRGRPAKLDENKVTKQYVPTGGKRGRPANPNKKVKVYIPTGGKRGRKPLSPEIKAQREQQALLPKGKRGRPKKVVSQD